MLYVDDTRFVGSKIESKAGSRMAEWCQINHDERNLLHSQVTWATIMYYRGHLGISACDQRDRPEKSIHKKTRRILP